MKILNNTSQKGIDMNKKNTMATGGNGPTKPPTKPKETTKPQKK